MVPLAFLPPHCASLTRRGAEAWVPSRLCHWKAIPVTLSCLRLPVPPPRPQKGGCLGLGWGRELAGQEAFAQLRLSFSRGPATPTHVPGLPLVRPFFGRGQMDPPASSPRF